MMRYSPPRESHIETYTSRGTLTVLRIAARMGRDTSEVGLKVFAPMPTTTRAPAGLACPAKTEHLNTVSFGMNPCSLIRLTIDSTPSSYTRNPRKPASMLRIMSASRYEMLSEPRSRRPSIAPSQLQDSFAPTSQAFLGPIAMMISTPSSCAICASALNSPASR